MSHKHEVQSPIYLPRENLIGIVQNALVEDIGQGDVTTLALIPEHITIEATFRVRENCVLCGLPVVELVFTELDRQCRIHTYATDGTWVQKNQVVATVKGPARAILTGERVALNFLQRLSGIATLTYQYVDLLKNTKTRLLDTRKTTPGFRFLEKYAVRCGGGSNHRAGLYDMILIKDNHLAIMQAWGLGNIQKAVALARERYPHLLVEVEADNLDQVQMALEAKADYVLLDNMEDVDLSRAILMRDKMGSLTALEASGGMTLERVQRIANLGLDYISVGALTHSARAVDIGLDIN